MDRFSSRNDSKCSLVAGWAACVCLAWALQAQSRPQFEVASIKAAPPGIPDVVGMTTRKGSLKGDNVTLLRCIMSAWDVGPNQVQGGPDWLGTDRFEILAKAADPVEDPVLMQMLQSLLAERFHLVLHRETRSIPVYLLNVSQKGAKLQASRAEEAGTTSTGNNAELRLDAHKITMAHLAEVLSRYLDRPVVDRTGIAGAYDLKLEWARGDSSDALPSIFTAVQEQLGLRITAERAPTEVLVIDHAEKPSEN